MARILLLGGHGKIAMKMTQILAARNHTVTSIIRNPDHADEIRALASDSHHINPVVASIEEADDDSAKKLMENIDWVIWSAGAGGKGGKERTKAVDEVAAKRFITAAIASPTPTKFLMVSANSSRRSPASYWAEKDKEIFKKSWEAIPDYCEAKTVADEFLWTESRKAVSKGEKKWQDICLRPGRLIDEAGTGKVDLGRAKLYPSVPRDDVAAVAVKLLERSDAENKDSAGLWIDLISGDEPIVDAVDRVLINKVSSRE
ncbi:NAD(P)-binding protein [Marasmius fiardii PR-910]|nr:NAD(P)-binding protein [Marasmius fiardii PR-910]